MTPTQQSESWSIRSLIGVRSYVFLLLLTSSGIMAMAWLGHLYFEDELTFGQAMMASWLMVLPEYALNIYALRIGYGKLSGGEMASINLATGVICVALVSRFVLGEEFNFQRIAGFILMGLAVLLVSRKKDESTEMPGVDSGHAEAPR